MPVELILLPRWFPIHLSKMSYWARTVIVPLLVLQAKKPLARNPRGVRVDELYDTPVRIKPKSKAANTKRLWTVGLQRPGRGAEGGRAALAQAAAADGRSTAASPSSPSG